MNTGTDLRARCAEVAGQVAERLADPDRVTRLASSGAPVPGAGDRLERVPWTPSGLADGYAGIALLFAELARDDPRQHRTAHRYLARSVTGLAAGGGGGLFLGLAGPAFAALCGRRRDGDYTGMIDRLDQHVRAEVRQVLAAEQERLAAGRPGADMRGYDTLAGLAGLGGYLLRRGDRRHLEPVLAYLVALTRPVRVDGVPAPGWWVAGPPSVDVREEELRRGHVNLGMAHGIAGPLALLALAWRDGVRVAGQAEAITRVVQALLDWRTATGGWPRYLTLAQARAGTPEPQPDRMAWCYGTPGTARAVQLAAGALARPDWAAAAVDALATALRPADVDAMMLDCTLCHGWSGLLHITQLVARDSADPRLSRAADRSAAALLDRFEPQSPFGFRHRMLGVVLDRPGLIEGAAGAALALQAYARNSVRTRWNTGILLD